MSQPILWEDERDKRDVPSAAEIEEGGQYLSQYPVDESRTNSNAGDATVYRFGGRVFEIIRWNERAVENKPGSITVIEIPDLWEEE